MPTFQFFHKHKQSHGCGYSMSMGNDLRSLSLVDVAKKVADVIYNLRRYVADIFVGPQPLLYAIF